ncbi:MAG: bifunctional glutamate N-acetyltransferase/amino-acid acetyltransferase ArgJ, partial [Pseudomonadota bacterium]
AEARGKSKKRDVKRPAGGVAPLAPPKFPDLPPVAGVRFATGSAGIKRKGGADVMLAALAPGTVMASIYTRSATRSAAVHDGENKRAALAGPGDALALIANSGNSNTFTGRVGAQAVAAIASAAGQALGIPAARVFTASTGVIGEPLDATPIAALMPKLVRGLSPGGAEDAARAIMTTDTFAKGATADGMVGGVPVRITGFAKGSGMIAPDMATMLAYLFTDAAVTQSALQAMLVRGAQTSFNAITVDSDTSTSDSVYLAATGQAGNATITSARGKDGRALAELTGRVMQDLALQIVRDGEGATKLIEVRVTGARSDRDAVRVARAIANSPLVKTAIAGGDPNWGRIVMAIGKSGAEADRDLLSVHFGDVLVAEAGCCADSYTEAAGAAEMAKDEITIAVDLGLGRGATRVWTCDLTHGYISINADYRS